MADGLPKLGDISFIKPTQLHQGSAFSCTHQFYEILKCLLAVQF